MKSQKALGEHQLSELRKRIEEVEETASTYKSQLAQQTQLHNQQQQISNNEIQKLQNSIELMQAELQSKLKQIVASDEKLSSKEQHNLELEKNILELKDQVNGATREKEELNARLTSLEDKSQKLELDREQVRLTSK